MGSRSGRFVRRSRMNWLQSALALQLLWVVFGFPVKESDGISENKSVSGRPPMEIIVPLKFPAKMNGGQNRPANERIEQVSEVLESKFNKKLIPKKRKYFKIYGKKQQNRPDMKFYNEKPEVVYSTLPNSFFPSVMPLIPYISRELEPPTRPFEHATRFIVPPVTIEVLPPTRLTKYTLKPNSLY